MKKITNLLSITLLSSLLACTGQVISQNVSIDTSKPAVETVPSSSQIKPSPIESAKPSTPKEKDYSKIVFSLKDNNTSLEETISNAPVFNSLNEQKSYYDETSLKNTKNYQDKDIIIYIGEKKPLDLSLVYLDGSNDKDYTVELADDFARMVELQSNNTLVALREGNFYLKVTSNKNKNIFKFFKYNIKFSQTFCCYTEFPLKTSFSGKILDPLGKPIDGAKVNVSVTDYNSSFTLEEKITDTTGTYFFKDVPIGAKAYIVVTKNGWTTRQRTEILKSNLDENPLVNKFNFEGFYAIQDEPEITSLRINEKIATGTGTTANRSLEGIDLSTANLTGLYNSSLTIEMTFSEPVNTEFFEEAFRVKNIKNGYIIDKNSTGINWLWLNEDKAVKIVFSNTLLANKEGNEEKYFLYFFSPFRDKNNTPARLGNYIRFNNVNRSSFNNYVNFNAINIGDYTIFSVKNDEISPKLLSITATDGANDVLDLKFSEPISVFNKKVNQLELLDPSDPNNRKKVLRIYKTNNKDSNNSTILGYSTVEDSLNLSDFRAVFNIARLTQPVVFKQKLLPLNINNSNSGLLIDGSSLISAKIIGELVRLELPSTAFNKGDRIILSIGITILEIYEDKNNGIPSFSLDVDTPNVTNASITDPSGNILSSVGSCTTKCSKDNQKTIIVQ